MTSCRRDSHHHDRIVHAANQLTQMLPKKVLKQLTLSYVKHLTALEQSGEVNYDEENINKPYIMTRLLTQRFPKKERRKQWGPDYAYIKNIVDFISRDIKEMEK